MSYMIAGRAVKNEWLSIGTLLTTAGGVMAWRALKGDAPAAKPVDSGASSGLGQTSSKEEEDFIRQFVAEAEKEEKQAGGGH